MLQAQELWHAVDTDTTDEVEDQMASPSWHPTSGPNGVRIGAWEQGHCKAGLGVWDSLKSMCISSNRVRKARV